MKKIMSLVLAAMLLFIVTCLPVMAIETDDKPNVIIDNGTGYVKAGNESHSKTDVPEIQLGSIVSRGNIWIPAGIGVAAVTAIAVVVVKKKKKPVLATAKGTAETETKE